MEIQMIFLTFLFAKTKSISVITLLLSVLNGLFTMWMFVILKDASFLQKHLVAGHWLEIKYFLILCFYILTDYATKYIIMSLIQNKLMHIKMDVTTHLLHLPLIQIETLGLRKIYATLTSDLEKISAAYRLLPFFFVNVAAVVCISIYLMYLSESLLFCLLLTTFLTISILGYLLPRTRIIKRHLSLKKNDDILTSHMQTFTFGIKDFLLDKKIAKSFIHMLKLKAVDCCDSNIHLYKQYQLLNTWVSSLSFVLMGILLLPDFYLPKKTIIMMLFIYVHYRLVAALTSISSFSKATLVLQELNQTGLYLHQNSIISSQEGDEFVIPEQFSLQFTHIGFDYPLQKQQTGFKLGPLSLTVQSGKTLFITGPNGGGKTTLAKVILGLYHPSEGRVLLNDQPIVFNDQYSALFAAILDDVCLSTDIHYFQNKQEEAEAKRWLAILKLSPKVTIHDGKLSTINVSKGQYKRLALLIALIKDRPIYVFDEWASEQDPYFRNWFYTELLPELKQKNKAVIAITHDDRYFNLSDDVMCIDYGQKQPRENYLTHRKVVI